MPLLVYPVLSVAFRQFLVTSTASRADCGCRSRTETQDEMATAGMLLAQGDKLLQRAQNRQRPARRLPGGPILGADLGGERTAACGKRTSSRFAEAVPTAWKISCANNKIDLGVRLAASRRDRQLARGGGSISTDLSPQYAASAGRRPILSNGDCGPSTSTICGSGWPQRAIIDRCEAALAAAARCRRERAFVLARHAGAAGADSDDDHRRPFIRRST